jgi:NAD(P)H-hydrate epimerase
VEVADIGIDADASLGDEPVFRLAGPSDVEHRLLQLRAPDAHKRASPVVILAGSDAMRGAALLAARGASRMGSGYVTLGCTEAVKDAAAVRVPEALATVVTDGDHLGPESLDRLAEVIDGAEALAIGPGLGRGPDQSALVERAVRELDVPLVLDADALNALEGKTKWLSEREQITVVTPHPGELARLLGRSTKEVSEDRLRAARDLHRLLGLASSFVVKGHRSITGGGFWDVYTIVPTGGPELATAGTGDVLTGAIAATMRRHVPDPDEPGASVEPPDVLTAAYVHGLAGTIAGERVGPSGVVAWDVAEALPEAVRRITGRLT